LLDGSIIGNIFVLNQSLSIVDSFGVLIGIIDSLFDVSSHGSYFFISLSIEILFES